MLKALVTDYQYIHLGIGIMGNAMFLIGSILFFESFEAWRTLAVWLFVLGSAGMLTGSLGKAAQLLIVARQKDGRDFA